MANGINPIILTDENGDKYTLEFNRAAIRYAEAQGFDASDTSKPMTMVTSLFTYAFYMHHRGIKQEKIDALLDGLGGFGGLTGEFIERLAALYQQPFETLKDESGEIKKATVRVEM